MKKLQSYSSADLVFTDAFTCYAVGVSGVLKKGTYVGTASATLPLTYSLTSTDWQWSNAVSGGSGTTAKINSIAMRNNHEGVVVGAGAHYVRFLTNYAGVYSQRFWYDKLGRIVLSQNTKQHDNGTYSYSLYDAQGRVEEAGVKQENTSTTGLHMSDVQGADVGGAFNPLAIEVSSSSGSSSASPFMQWITQGANTSTGVNTTRTEVTRTTYDAPLVSGIPSFTQNNLRKRVSTVVYQKVYHSNASQGYAHATHYSYDIHGNVNELVQDNPEMAVTSSLSDQRYKRMEYDYDLISGKVNRVSYQRGARDAWHHWYEYDADNRITQVYTSTHPDPIAMAGTTITDPTVVSALWEEDSKYFYYAHGPLMRQELGSNQVQGVDYAYTLQGWIKGINSNALDATKDMGHDGSGTGLNGRFGRDVASFSLSYYEGDFSSVASTGAFSGVVGSDLEAQSAELYNGNIRIMQTTLMENNGSGALTASNLGMAYKYDQLNRLKQAKGFTQYAPSTNSWSASSGAACEHNNFFTFDANGNIVAQQRYEGSTLVDNLSYQYATNSAGDLLSNRLYSVDDAVMNASLSATDMEDMPTYINASPNTSNNYTYTQIGELKSDNQEEISEIHWRVDSKISEIVRTSGSVKKNLKFEYDAMGNRVAKHVYAGSLLESSTYYVRDAQGNVMGVYEHKMDAENAVMEYKLIERNIYGSAQVGICKDTVDLNITNSSGALTQATYYHARQLNHRQYSLSNHLGNVLTTIGDGKAAMDSNNDGVIDYFTAYIISVSDYSPFGVELASRTWSIEEYRSGFNGKEKVNEITGNFSDYDFGARIYNARIGRWLSVDPLTVKYPDHSVYNYCKGNAILNRDPDGRDVIIAVVSYAKKPHGAGSKGHMAVIVGNEIDGYTVFSIENESQMKEYIKLDEKVFQGRVRPFQSWLSGTERVIFYKHTEKSFNDMFTYLSQNAPGVKNEKPKNKGFGYDRYLVKEQSMELDKELIDYLSNKELLEPEYKGYEFISNNCASTVMDYLNNFCDEKGIERMISDHSIVDIPNREFDKIERGNRGWSVIIDRKGEHDNERKENRKKKKNKEGE